MKTVLVTGGGGFLGRRITLALLERGWRVRVLGRRRYPDLEARGVEGVVGDLRDFESVQAGCRNAAAVIHTAAIPGIWGRQRDFFEVNARGTQHVIEAVVRAGVPRLIFTSSPSVVYAGRDIRGGSETALPYPKRYLAHYPASKAQAEQAVLAADGRPLSPDNSAKTRGALTTVALRPHLIWGPGDQHLVPGILRAARRGRLYQIGRGDNLVDLTYVDNAAQAHVLALERLGPDSPIRGRPFFISDGQPVRLWDWINELLRRLGLEPVRRRVSFRTSWLLGAANEVVYRLLRRRRQPPMTRFLAAQLGTSHYFDISAARRLLGYDPPVSPETGMRRLIEWLITSQAGK